MKRLLIFTILTIFVLSCSPLTAYENSYILNKLIQKFTPEEIIDNIDYDLRSYGGKKGDTDSVPYIIKGDKLNLNFTKDEIQSENFKGILEYNSLEDSYKIKMNADNIILKDSFLFNRLLTSFDLHDFLYSVYSGRIDIYSDSDTIKLEFNIHGHPGRISGYLKYKNGYAQGKLNIRWRYRKLHDKFYYLHFIQDSFSKRDMDIYFIINEDGKLEYASPSEFMIKDLTCQILQGKNKRFKFKISNKSLNPVLKSCSRLLSERNSIFRDKTRYYFNLINIQIPNYLVINKKLPLYEGSFRDYSKIDIYEFIEQIVFEYINRLYMIEYKNYFMNIPEKLKIKFETSFFTDFELEDIRNFSLKEKIIVEYFIYRQLRINKFLKSHVLKMRKTGIDLQKNLIKLIKIDNSFRVTSHDADANNRLFYYYVFYGLLIDMLRKDGLDDIVYSEKLMIFKQLEKNIDKKKFLNREKKLYFYLERNRKKLSFKL